MSSNNKLYVELVECGILKHGSITGSKAKISSEIRSGTKELSEGQKEKFNESLEKIIAHLRQTKTGNADEIVDFSSLGESANGRSVEEKRSIIEGVCQLKDIDLWKDIEPSQLN
jgi:hypothetical protein